MTPTLSLHSPRAATVDALRGEQAPTLGRVLGITGFALLTALCAQVEVRLYLWEVPFTLQTLAVYGSGLYLGWRGGLLAQGFYLVLGLFWPVYAGGHGGGEYLLGAASAGYLWGFPLAAAVAGKLSERWNSLAGSVLSVAAGSLVLFACGVSWLHFAAGHATWWESIAKGWLAFITIDLAKILLVSACYAGSRRL